MVDAEVCKKKKKNITRHPHNQEWYHPKTLQQKQYGSVMNLTLGTEFMKVISANL